MKKKQLVRLLGLVSCVSLLASCGAKKPENPSMSVKEFADIVHVGDVLDLDSYVTTKGTSKSYSVYLYKASQSFAKLDGHKITIKGEGEIKFLISLGDIEQKIVVNSMYEMRHKLIESFSSFNDEYYAFGGLTGDIYLHNANYAERVRTDKANNAQLRNGYLSTLGGDAAYTFNVDSSYQMTASAKISEKSVLEKANSFRPDVAKAERGKSTIDGEQVEVYTLTGTPLKNFVQNLMLSSTTAHVMSVKVDGEGKYDPQGESYGDVSATISKVELTYVTEGDISEPYAIVYGKLSGKSEMLDVLAFETKAASQISDPICTHYVENPSDIVFLKNGTTQEEDPAVYYLKTIFGQNISSARSYTASFDYGWFNSAGERIAEPDDLDGTIFAGVPAGSSVKVLADQAIVTIENDKVVSGLVQKTEGGDTTVYDVSYDSVHDSHSFDENPDFDDVYEDEYNSLAFIAEEQNTAFDGFYLSKTKNNGTEETEDDTLVFSANLKRHYDFIDGVCSCEDTLSKLVTVLYQYESRDLKKYFSFNLEFTPQTELLHCDFSLNWDDGVIYKVIFECSPDSSAYSQVITDLLAELN